MKHKKYTAVFYDDQKKKIKTTHFGDNKYQDFTQHGDETRRASYISRHSAREDWNNYMSAGSLSHYILWSHKNIDTAKSKYMKKFGLKAYT